MSVLAKLHSCSLDITSYTDSSDQIWQAKHYFIAEKCKVLRALAGSKAKVYVPKLPASRHIKKCTQFVANVSEALNVAPAHQWPDTLMVTSEGGKGMSEKSKSQKLKQLDAAGAI